MRFDILRNMAYHFFFQQGVQERLREQVQYIFMVKTLGEMQAEIGDKKVVERRLLQRVTHRDVHTCFGLYSLQYRDEQILIGDDEGGFFQCFGRRIFE